MGVEKKFFVHPERISSQLLCLICLDVLENPVQTPCEHLFCDADIREWLKSKNTCPADQSRVNQNQIKTASRIVLNMLGELERFCKNKEKGCIWSGPSDRLQTHLKSHCSFEQSYDLGQTVEMRSQGRTDITWNACEVQAKHNDGMYSLLLQDGSVEAKVNPERIRQKEYAIGDAVEARWRGKPTWYPGKVAGKNTDGSYIVKYNDGDLENNVPSKFIREKKATNFKAVEAPVSVPSQVPPGFGFATAVPNTPVFDTPAFVSSTAQRNINFESIPTISPDCSRSTLGLNSFAAAATETSTSRRTEGRRILKAKRPGRTSMVVRNVPIGAGTTPPTSAPFFPHTVPQTEQANFGNVGTPRVIHSFSSGSSTIQSPVPFPFFESPAEPNTPVFVSPAAQKTIILNQFQPFHQIVHVQRLAQILLLLQQQRPHFPQYHIGPKGGEF